MAREFTNNFYKNTKWIRCRASFIKIRSGIDGGLCEKCKERPGFIVHHKIELDEQNINDPDVTLNHENLEYLCLECHNKIHGYVKKKKISGQIDYAFDCDGNPVPEGPP